MWRVSGRSRQDSSINVAFSMEWPSEAYAVQRLTDNSEMEAIKPALLWERLSSCPGDEPVIVSLPRVWAHLREDPELKKQMSMFESDCGASHEFKNSPGRVAKLSNDSEIRRALGGVARSALIDWCVCVCVFVCCGWFVG